MIENLSLLMFIALSVYIPCIQVRTLLAERSNEKLSSRLHELLMLEAMLGLDVIAEKTRTAIQAGGTSCDTAATS